MEPGRCSHASTLKLGESEASSIVPFPGGPRIGSPPRRLSGNLDHRPSTRVLRSDSAGVCICAPARPNEPNRHGSARDYRCQWGGADRHPANGERHSTHERFWPARLRRSRELIGVWSGRYHRVAIHRSGLQFRISCFRVRRPGPGGKATDWTYAKWVRRLRDSVP